MQMGKRWLWSHCLRITMAKKNKPENAIKARVRISPKRAAKHASVKKASTRKKEGEKVPLQKLFDAKKWFGAFPDLAGPTLKIQREMRCRV